MNAILYYRWFVFLTAAFYVVYLVLIDGDYSQAFGPFRFLTIWALLFSFFAASRMLALTEGRSTRDWPAVVLVTTTLNIMVVYLYWDLVFKDPALVRGNGPIRWWLDYYAHLAGPLVQWIDALFLHRRLRALPIAGALLGAVILVYLSFAELVLEPLNDQPFGSVTSGLPYPFLNSLEFDGRLSFYVTTAIAAAVVMVVVYGLSLVIRRVQTGAWRPAPAYRSGTEA